MKTRTRTTLRIAAAAAGLAFMTGCIASGDAGSESAAAARAKAAEQAAAESKAEKVSICHLPPGNPANMQSLSVGAPAVDAHLAHGDSLGACPEDGGGDDTVVDSVDVGAGST